MSVYDIGKLREKLDLVFIGVLYHLCHPLVRGTRFAIEARPEREVYPCGKGERHTPRNRRH